MQHAKIKIFILFLITLSLSFYSCQPEIKRVENIKIANDGIHMDMQINNPYPFTVKLSNFHMSLLIDNYEFPDVIYQNELVLKPFSKKFYPVIIDVKPLQHPLESSGALMSMITQDSTLVVIEGSSLVKTFLLKKRFNFKDSIYIKYNK